MVPVERSPARLAGADGDAGELGQCAQRRLGAGVQDAAASDDEGPFRPLYRGRRGFHGPFLGQRATDVPLPLAQESIGHVHRLSLHVLGQRDRDRSGLGRVGQYAHCGQRDREQLLGTLYPVEEAGQRPERVGHLDAGIVRVLQLLQDRVGHPGGESIRWQQQRGHPVRGGQGRAGQQVGRAWPDRGGRGERGPATVDAGVADGLMDHGLLVARLVIREQVRPGRVVLLERLPEAGHVAVPEDAEESRDSALADVAVHGPLGGEKLDEGLADGQSAGRHRIVPSRAGA